MQRLCECSRSRLRSRGSLTAPKRAPHQERDIPHDKPRPPRNGEDSPVPGTPAHSGESPPTMRRHRVSRGAPRETPHDVHSGTAPELPCLTPLTAAEFQHQRQTRPAVMRIQIFPHFYRVQLPSQNFLQTLEPSPRETPCAHAQNFLFNFKGPVDSQARNWGAPPQGGGGPDWWSSSHPHNHTQCSYSLQSRPPFLELFPKVGQKADEWLWGSVPSSERGR